MTIHCLDRWNTTLCEEVIINLPVTVAKIHTNAQFIMKVLVFQNLINRLLYIIQTAHILYMTLEGSDSLYVILQPYLLARVF